MANSILLRLQTGVVNTSHTNASRISSTYDPLARARMKANLEGKPFTSGPHLFLARGGLQNK